MGGGWKRLIGGAALLAGLVAGPARAEPRAPAPLPEDDEELIANLELLTWLDMLESFWFYVELEEEPPPTAPEPAEGQAPERGER